MDAGSRWRDIQGSAAEIYAQHLAPGMFTPWAPIVVDLVGAPPGEHGLDVACGTGVVTRVLAERVGAAGRAVGLDFSAGMLAVARTHQPLSAATIEWVEADATAMPLPDATFDVVVMQHGLQQIPDRAAVLREMLRVLRPGGRVGICVWSTLEGSPGMAALVAALALHVSEAAADNRRAPFALGDATLLHDLVHAAGFTAVRLETRSMETGFSSADALVNAQLAATPLSTLGDLSEETLQAVLKDVRAALAPWTTDDTFRVPMTAHLVSARKPD